MGTNWAYVSTGMNHTVAIGGDGSLWAWGNNISGQLGDGTQGEGNYSNIPIRIGTDNNWRYVSAGAFYTMAIRTDGTLWAWGNNGYGRLGDGTATQRSMPVRVGSDYNWISASAGSQHTMAIGVDGSLWVWGNNSFGVLGDGTRINHRTRSLS